jgi:lipopolysaccharide cholinephosphotransferase
MPQDNLAKAQNVMLNLLEAFDRVCRANHLTYWLDHGTLLGAVRHSGFIPWDDDLDVTMPREDYERFLELAGDELPESIFLQTKASDPSTPVHYAKLRDRNSTYIDKWEEGRSDRYHQGIFIVIFPVNFIAFEKRTRYKNILNMAKIFSNRYIKIDFMAKWMIQYLNRFHDEAYRYVVSGGESMHYVTHVKKETVFPLKQLSFEGKEFPVPRDYQAYLVSIFGENYMELPPKE